MLEQWSGSICECGFVIGTKDRIFNHEGQEEKKNLRNTKTPFFKCFIVNLYLIGGKKESLKPQSARRNAITNPKL